MHCNQSTNARRVQHCRAMFAVGHAMESRRVDAAGGRGAAAGAGAGGASMAPVDAGAGPEARGQHLSGRLARRPGATGLDPRPLRSPRPGRSRSGALDQLRSRQHALADHGGCPPSPGQGAGPESHGSRRFLQPGPAGGPLSPCRSPAA
jgi:hypothetical protein